MMKFIILYTHQNQKMAKTNNYELHRYMSGGGATDNIFLVLESVELNKNYGKIK